MKSLLTGCVVALALGATAGAQDSTVKSTTKVKADDARTVTMTGCLQQSPGNASFMLSGAMTASGEDLTAKTKIKSDVDKDDTTVTSKSSTKVDRDDRSVGTSGVATSYEVTAREGVDLAAHVGQQVQIAAVMLDPATSGDDDAKVKIEDRTKVKTEDAPDEKVQTKTKAELPRAPHATLTAVSVKQLAATCAAQ
jgi:hypothetical protein